VHQPTLIDCASTYYGYSLSLKRFYSGLRRKLKSNSI